MDRDHARGFVKQVLKKETEFLEELKAFEEKMESAEDWESASRDFAPRVKAFYNAQLEQWQRYYLGLDSANMKFGFSVMHTAQKKERKAAEATIPHSVFGELKQKIKVGQTTTKLSATGGKAAREIIEKKLGQGGLVEIESRGKGGKIGGGQDAVYDEDYNPADHVATESKPPLSTVPTSPQKQSKEPEPVTTPTKKLTPAQLKFGIGPEAEKKPDPQLNSILQRRKDLYGAGKY